MNKIYKIVIFENEVCKTRGFASTNSCSHYHVIGDLKDVWEFAFEKCQGYPISEVDDMYIDDGYQIEENEDDKIVHYIKQTLIEYCDYGSGEPILVQIIDCENNENIFLNNELEEYSIPIKKNLLDDICLFLNIPNIIYHININETTMFNDVKDMLEYIKENKIENYSQFNIKHIGDKIEVYFK